MAPDNSRPKYEQISLVYDDDSIRVLSPSGKDTHAYRVVNDGKSTYHLEDGTPIELVSPARDGGLEQHAEQPSAEAPTSRETQYADATA